MQLPSLTKKQRIEMFCSVTHRSFKPRVELHFLTMPTIFGAFYRNIELSREELNWKPRCPRPSFSTLRGSSASFVGYFPTAGRVDIPEKNETMFLRPMPTYSRLGLSDFCEFK